MIVVDIETSGLHPETHGIWQIGALDFYHPENMFLEEGKIDAEDKVDEGALQITGKTETYLRDNRKQSQRDLLDKFFRWTQGLSIKNAICQNPQFDVSFIQFKARRYGLRGVDGIDPYSPFYHRAFDLHSIASLAYQQLHGDLLLEKDHSEMGLKNILKLCGLQDQRKEHHALEDAMLTAECFSRLVHGRSLLREYAHYKIPEYLQR